MSRLLDMTGKRFGRLIALRRDEDAPKGYHITAKWICLCDCGNTVSVAGPSLRRGLTMSCGCLLQEKRKVPKNITHGDSKSTLFSRWSGMRQRCNNPNNSSYDNYGGRGIKICAEWETYVNFKEWALSNGFEEGLTIERKDVNGNYCPENCTFATAKEQGNNRRNSAIYQFEGKTQTIAQWSDELGIKGVTIRARLRKGWTLEEAFCREVRSWVHSA